MVYVVVRCGTETRDRSYGCGGDPDGDARCFWDYPSILLLAEPDWSPNTLAWTRIERAGVSLVYRSDAQYVTELCDCGGPMGVERGRMGVSIGRKQVRLGARSYWRCWTRILRAGRHYSQQRMVRQALYGEADADHAAGVGVGGGTAAGEAYDDRCRANRVTNKSPSRAVP